MQYLQTVQVVRLKQPHSLRLEHANKSIALFGLSGVMGEPGSSGSVVSGYGLDDRGIEVRSPAEANGFFL
jgi:hypothetical protein